MFEHISGHTYYRPIPKKYRINGTDPGGSTLLVGPDGPPSSPGKRLATTIRVLKLIAKQPDATNAHIAKAAEVSPARVTAAMRDYLKVYLAAESSDRLPGDVIEKFSNPEDGTGITEQEFRGLIPVAERYKRAVNEGRIKGFNKPMSEADYEDYDAWQARQEIVDPTENLEFLPTADRKISSVQRTHQSRGGIGANGSPVPSSIYGDGGMPQTGAAMSGQASIPQNSMHGIMGMQYGMSPVEPALINNPQYRQMVLKNAIEKAKDQWEERRIDRIFRQINMSNLLGIMRAQTPMNHPGMGQHIANQVAVEETYSEGKVLSRKTVPIDMYGDPVAAGSARSEAIKLASEQIRMFERCFSRDKEQRESIIKMFKESMEERKKSEIEAAKKLKKLIDAERERNEDRRGRGQQPGEQGDGLVEEGAERVLEGYVSEIFQNLWMTVGKLRPGSYREASQTRDV
jgi:hypothetical protein